MGNGGKTGKHERKVEVELKLKIKLEMKWFEKNEQHISRSGQCQVWWLHLTAYSRNISEMFCICSL